MAATLGFWLGTRFPGSTIISMSGRRGSCKLDSVSQTVCIKETRQLLRGLEGEVRLDHGERVAQTAGGRGGGTGPGYGESLSSLSVDLRMVIYYSISSDQTQYHNLRKK